VLGTNTGSTLCRGSGVMIRSRDEVQARFRRGRRDSRQREHRDEPLRILVRILARQAAREWFDREVSVRGEATSEVILQ
jgi:hypothetical protein